MGLKIPRKIELKESKYFIVFFNDFWEKHSGDFAHINPEHLIFIRSKDQLVEPLKKFVELKVLGKDERIFLPNFYYKLIVRDAFNFIELAHREYVIFNALYQIPKDYRENLRLRKPDYVGFVQVMQKFKQGLAKGLLGEI